MKNKLDYYTKQGTSLDIIQNISIFTRVWHLHPTVNNYNFVFSMTSYEDMLCCNDPWQMCCSVQMCEAWVWWLEPWSVFHSVFCSSFSSSGWSSARRRRRNMRRRRRLMRSGEISALCFYRSTLTLNIPAADRLWLCFWVQDDSLLIVFRTIFIIHQTAVV